MSDYISAIVQEANQTVEGKFIKVELDMCHRLINSLQQQRDYIDEQLKEATEREHTLNVRYAYLINCTQEGFPFDEGDYACYALRDRLIKNPWEVNLKIAVQLGVPNIELLGAADLIERIVERSFAEFNQEQMMFNISLLEYDDEALQQLARQYYVDRNLERPKMIEAIMDAHARINNPLQN